MEWTTDWAKGRGPYMDLFSRPREQYWLASHRQPCTTAFRRVLRPTLLWALRVCRRDMETNQGYPGPNHIEAVLKEMSNKIAGCKDVSLNNNETNSCSYIECVFATDRNFTLILSFIGTTSSTRVQQMLDQKMLCFHPGPTPLLSFLHVMLSSLSHACFLAI